MQCKVRAGDGEPAPLAALSRDGAGLRSEAPSCSALGQAARWEESGVDERDRGTSTTRVALMEEMSERNDDTPFDQLGLARPSRNSGCTHLVLSQLLYDVGMREASVFDAPEQRASIARHVHSVNTDELALIGPNRNDSTDHDGPISRQRRAPDPTNKQSTVQSRILHAWTSHGDPLRETRAVGRRYDPTPIHLCIQNQERRQTTDDDRDDHPCAWWSRRGWG